MIRALIVDDERKGRETLHKLLTEYCPALHIAGMADSAAAAYDLIEQEEPDLVFLDVEMPGGTGFDLLERFDKVQFKVVFTTAYGHYAIKAIKFSAFDYLLKPVEIDELRAVVNRFEEDRADSAGPTENERPAAKGDTVADLSLSVKTLLENLRAEQPNRKLVVPDMNGMTVIHTRDIVRFESESSYCTVHLSDGSSHILSKHLRHFESVLTDYTNFIRVHRSHLINLNYVKRYIRGEGGYAMMSDNSKVEISRRKKNEFLDLLSDEV